MSQSQSLWLTVGRVKRVITSNWELFRGRDRKVEVPLARAPTGSTRSPLRAPPGSPKSPLRAPPGSPKSPLRVPPGSPRSDLPPLPPPPVSPNSRPKLFFLLSKVPHWLFAISGFSLYKPDISLLLLLPPHLLMHSPSTYCLFEKVFFRISITSLPLFSFLFFLFTLSLLFCHLSAVYSFFTVTAITWFYPVLLVFTWLSLGFTPTHNLFPRCFTVQSQKIRKVLQSKNPVKVKALSKKCRSTRVLLNWYPQNYTIIVWGIIPHAISASSLYLH